MSSLSRKMKILSILARSSWKQKLNFSHRAQFHKKNRVCLKYFVHDCLCKKHFHHIFRKKVYNLKSQKTLKNVLRTMVCLQSFIVSSKNYFEKKKISFFYSPRVRGDVFTPFGMRALTQNLKSLLRGNQFFLCQLGLLWGLLGFWARFWLKLSS